MTNLTCVDHMLTSSATPSHVAGPSDTAGRTIDCGKQVTLAHIGLVHLALLHAVRNGGSLHLDLSQLDAIDASFVQLIVSVAKTARQSSQVLTLAPLTDEVADAFARAGLTIDPTTGQPSLN